MLAVVFPRLQVFTHDAFFKVNAVVRESGAAGKCQHRRDRAAVANLAACRDLTLYAEFIEISNVRTTDLSPALKYVVAADPHCALNNIALFVLARLVPNLNELLNNRVVADNYVAALRDNIAHWMDDTPFAKDYIAMQLRPLADNWSGLAGLRGGSYLRLLGAHAVGRCLGPRFVD